MKAFLGMSPGMAMLVYRSIGWIAMQFCTDIHSPQRMHLNDIPNKIGSGKCLQMFYKYQPSKFKNSYGLALICMLK